MTIRVLGLDPGTATFGWGLVESGGERPRHLGHGVIATSAALDLGQRLLKIQDELRQIVQRERPDRIALERIFAQGNVQSAVAVAAARGAALMVAAECGLDTVEATPSEMKRAIAGDGRAAKGAVVRAVTRLLGLDRAPHPDDAADAEDGQAQRQRTPPGLAREAPEPGRAGVLLAQQRQLVLHQRMADNREAGQ